MKKNNTIFSIILIFIYIPIYLSGQVNNILVDSNKEWSILQQIYDPSVEGSVRKETFYIKFSEDTVINPYVYKKVFQTYDSLKNNWAVIGYIREDSTKKIYYKPMYNNDFLIYDFNVVVNDTIVMFCHEYDTMQVLPLQMIVDSIDSVWIHNRFCKRIYLNGYKAAGIWIEGMGGMDGIIHSFRDGTVGGHFYELLCFEENDTLKYINSDYNTCYYMLTGIEEFQKTAIENNIYPNPFSNSTNIEYNLENDTYVSFYIYNSFGKLITVLAENENQKAGNYKYTFNAKNLPAGLYFYVFRAGAYQETKKLILLK